MSLFLTSTGAAGGGFSTIIMLIAMFAIFYFLIIRPENKKKKKTEEMRNSLNLGEEIVTIGGMTGKILLKPVKTVCASRSKNGQFPLLQRWKPLKLKPKQRLPDFSERNNC